MLLAGASVLSIGAFTQQPAFAITFDWDAYFDGVQTTYSWGQDRSDTQAYSIGSYYGRDNVLDLTISDAHNLPWNIVGFYETEGYKTATNLPVGSTYVSGDLYIPASWATQTAEFQSVGLWGTIGVAPGTANSYPIVNFYNGDVGGGAIRVWDTDHYVVVSAPINYDGWNTFRLNYLPGVNTGDGQVQVVVNGTVVYTLTGGDLGVINPATNSQYEVILNAHTNGVDDYDTYWSNLMFGLNEVYSLAPSIAPSAILAGDQLLGTYVDRRGLDWHGEQSAWVHVVGGHTGFSDGSVGASADLTGAQFGMDMLTLGDASTRAGLTFGISSQLNDVTVGSVNAGTTNGTSASIGAYLTHASDGFYADLLGQYRFLTYDVSAPSSTGKITGGSLDTTAEAGVHFGNDGFMLTPFAQLSYQHVMLNDTTLGGLPVSFGNSDALIARGRVLAQAQAGGIKLFGSAGVAANLLGDTQTTVFGTTTAVGIGGPRAEFTAGVEGAFGGLNLFGSGEYDVSFDGATSTYLGRAGARVKF